MRRRIRLLEVTDAERLAELLLTNRTFLEPWSPARSTEYFTVSSQRAELEADLAGYERGDGLPLVILDEEQQVAGRLTLSGVVRGAFESCHMGYWLDESSNGRGFVTEAVRDAVALAFSELGLHRVQAATLPHNAASQRVLAKCGFEKIGMAPRYLRIAGRWQDHVLFQKLAE